ncbi:magnesium-transporting ATPase (P-type) [Sphingobacterium sp. BIGb0165]|nr:magnesium-transporting ATPase (P-type) [Sphingobacterium sp. BIGb0165]
MFTWKYMKKIIFRFSLFNLLLCILLFILYRIVISRLEPAGATLFDSFLSIMDLFLSLGFSMLYVVVICVSTPLFFLNQIEKIRNSYFLSLLTFSGIPFLCVVFLAVTVLVDIYQYSVTLIPLKILLCFSIIYLLCTIVEFLVFRKKLRKVMDS